ncbi:hypothetical protein BC629DRAFT_1440364 [Irpex lacteus]|nr:hypothetical protein BC629DRAFT_1440364 [Irpex lacteus]
MPRTSKTYLRPVVSTCTRKHVDERGDVWRNARNNNSFLLAYAAFKEGGADLDDPRVAIAYDEEAEASVEYLVAVDLSNILNATTLGIVMSDRPKPSFVAQTAYRHLASFKHISGVSRVFGIPTSKLEENFPFECEICKRKYLRTASANLHEGRCRRKLERIQDLPVIPTFFSIEATTDNPRIQAQRNPSTPEDDPGSSDDDEEVEDLLQELDSGPSCPVVPPSSPVPSSSTLTSPGPIPSSSPTAPSSPLTSSSPFTRVPCTRSRTAHFSQSVPGGLFLKFPLANDEEPQASPDADSSSSRLTDCDRPSPPSSRHSSPSPSSVSRSPPPSIRAISPLRDMPVIPYRTHRPWEDHVQRHDPEASSSSYQPLRLSEPDFGSPEYVVVSPQQEVIGHVYPSPRRPMISQASFTTISQASSTTVSQANWHRRTSMSPPLPPPPPPTPTQMGYEEARMNTLVRMACLMRSQNELRWDLTEWVNDVRDMLESSPQYGNARASEWTGEE